MDAHEAESQAREDEAHRILERGARIRWGIAVAVVLGITGWFLGPRFRPPCDKARIEICRDLLVSCERLRDAMQSDPPDEAWCEQFLEPEFIEQRGDAAAVVHGRYPQTMLTQDEQATIRHRGGHGGPVILH